jgi:hypothetical protein
LSNVEASNTGDSTSIAISTACFGLPASAHASAALAMATASSSKRVISFKISVTTVSAISGVMARSIIDGHTRGREGKSRTK